MTLNKLSKNMMAALLVLSCSGGAMAVPVATEKTMVLNVMKKYVEATSCWHSFESDIEFQRTSVKDVYLIESDKELESSIYYVLWSGDQGCSGGIGSMSNFMSEVSRFSNSRPFVVQNDQAFGDIDINFRFIESVKQISKDKFEITSWNYSDAKYGGKDEGTNSPANKFKYTVERDTYKPWKITNQVLLGQKK